MEPFAIVLLPPGVPQLTLFKSGEASRMMDIRETRGGGSKLFTLLPPLPPGVRKPGIVIRLLEAAIDEPEKPFPVWHST